ncbi:MAG: rhodanese-like domain-containing protein [Pyrinomonadaceae bacterium]
MRLFISLAAAMALAVVALTACNSNDGSGSKTASKQQTTNTTTTTTTTQTPAPVVKQPQQQPPGDGVRRITVAELREAVDKGTAVIVDVRSLDQYKTNHIKGALHIPEAEVAARSGELPPGKTIVTYCS